MPKIQKNKKKQAQKLDAFSTIKNFKKPKIFAALAILVALPAIYLGVNSFEHQTFAGTINIGTDTVLPSTTQQAATYKGATQYSVSETGTISSITMYMDGKGGTSGSQTMQMAIYSDNNGNPGTLMGSSATQTVTAGSAATWKNFPLASTVSVTAGTKVWLSSYSPSGSNLVRIYGDSAAGYKSIYNVNSGTAPSASFGSGTTYTGRQSYYAIEMLSSTTPSPTPTPPAPTPTPTPTPTPSGTPSAALSVWKTSLGNTVNAPAKWLAIGESLTEGQGASTISKRWLNLDRDKLRTNFTTTGTSVGGENYIPAIYRVYAPDSLWTKPYTNAKGTLTPVYWPGNLGYRALQFSRGAAATYPVNGDSVDLWYIAGTTGGSFSYKVDNGTAVTVNTYSAAYNASARVQNLPLGASGSHTITITSTAGSPVLSGISVFKGDRTKGVQVYDTSYSGATVSVYLADLAQFHQAVANVAPQLVTIELGGNDFENGTDPAVFKSQLIQLINDLKTLPNVPSIMLVPPYECYTSSPTKYPYSSYVTAAKEIAAADPDHVTTYALSDYFPKGDTSGKGYYRTDGIHPNDTGQSVIANLIYGAITQ